MVSHDWIVVAINYRTTAKAGYPTQLIDCKRALRWVKDEIRTFGGDSNNIVVAGDAAGGQLASLLAMTPNLPEYQPGFEKVDTTVQGCIAMSADLDLVDAKNYSNHDSRGRFISAVAKRSGSAESAESKSGVGIICYYSEWEVTRRTPLLIDLCGHLHFCRPQIFGRAFTTVQDQRVWRPIPCRPVSLLAEIYAKL